MTGQRSRLSTELSLCPWVLEPEIDHIGRSKLTCCTVDWWEKCPGCHHQPTELFGSAIGQAQALSRRTRQTCLSALRGRGYGKTGRRICIMVKSHAPSPSSVRQCSTSEPSLPSCLSQTVSTPGTFSDTTKPTVLRLWGSQEAPLGALFSLHSHASRPVSASYRVPHICRLDSQH